MCAIGHNANSGGIRYHALLLIDRCNAVALAFSIYACVLTCKFYIDHFNMYFKQFQAVGTVLYFNNSNYINITFNCGGTYMFGCVVFNEKLV